MIDQVINLNQSAFVPGQQIHDNIMVMHEILHPLKQGVDGEEGRMAIELDMAKANDRVEWGFLIEVMGNLGFHPKFCEWIRECISTVSYSVMVNGVPSSYFRPEMGLRQGDPMSPFLFLICAEALSSYNQKHEMKGQISRVLVATAVTPITHLFFADDSVVFCKADGTEVDRVKILEDYGMDFGQIINLE
ncbi:secreted RxLR effector protein 78-like [Malus domestica]|uniref:secreted RxLR effector protein 78-like n=1 Tax=Malus domestica TaxID=3750 RepID=UPI003974BCCC